MSNPHQVQNHAQATHGEAAIPASGGPASSVSTACLFKGISYMHALDPYETKYLY